MFIGGGSMSTASGIKVVTFVVLILSTYGYLRRDEGAIHVFRREISKETVSKALALTLISIVATWLGIFGLLLVRMHRWSLSSLSSFCVGTVGLSRGSDLFFVESGEFIIMLLMFMGAGHFTLAYFLASPRTHRLRYPKPNLRLVD
ncbi:potassium transporter TrkG [Vibrio sp. PP-XX7]